MSAPWSLHLHLAAPPWRDIALAAIAVVFDLFLFAEPAALGSPMLIVLAVIGFVALAWRQTAPITVFLLMLAESLVAATWVSDYRPSLGLWIALYTVTALRDWRISVAALLATLGVTASIAISQELTQNPDHSSVSIIVYSIALYSVVTVGVWLLGRWAQQNRHRFQSLDRRHRREASAAVNAERRRIARELHDIVSNSVSVMTLQAAGARAVLETDPERANEALVRIEGVGKESMGELRRLLGVLDDSGLVDDAAEPGSQRGLADIPTMVDAMRFSGLDVELVVVGRPAQLAPSVDLSAYRIVQEALTNCLKHAGRGAAATVRVGWSSSILSIEVTNDGGLPEPKGSALSTEHGLPGLRERARAVGGSLDAGPAAGGGYRVAATLPIAPPVHHESAQKNNR